MSSCVLRKMIQKFETTGNFVCLPGRGRNKTFIMWIPKFCLLASKIGESLKQSLKTVVIIYMAVWVCQMFPVYWISLILLYKKSFGIFFTFISTNYNYVLNAGRRFRGSLKVCSLIFFWDYVDWPWDILLSDKTYFCLNGKVNTYNCRTWTVVSLYSSTILASENSNSIV